MWCSSCEVWELDTRTNLAVQQDRFDADNSRIKIDHFLLTSLPVHSPTVPSKLPHSHVKCICLHCTSPQQGNECTCANSEVYWGRALFGVLQTSAYIQLRCVYKQNVLKDHGYSSPPTHTHAHTHRCSTFSMVNECNRLSCIIQLVQVPHTVHSGEKTKQSNNRSDWRWH